MSYLDVYFSRLNHLGNTTQERIQNGGIRSFYKWMAESPFTVMNLSTEKGYYFDGIIETNKDKEYEKIMFLYVANDIPLSVGDIMNWTVEDGTTEKWILAQKVKKVNGAYQTFWIIRCNYLLKWIDPQGHLQQSWSYVVSSVDSKIKGNYRTWNNLITPQPNKYAEILMPRYPIERATNFIIEQESWSVVEYDHTSVPGTIYLSLTENKINLIYDDIENNIADTDKLAQYDLIIPESQQVYSIGNTVNPVFTLTKNGVPYDEEVELISTNLSVVNNFMQAVGLGTATIIVRLKNYPQIEKTLEVTVSNDEQEFSAYIEGADTLRLARKSRYTLKATGDIIGEVNFEVSDNTLAEIVEVENDYCVVQANEKNKLDSFILTATYNGQSYEKSIKLIPLW